MDLRTAIFLAAVAIIGVFLIAILVRSQRRARRSAGRDWEQLLGRLVSVDRRSIAEVALDVIDESGEPRRDTDSAVLEPRQIWDLVGGMNGLETLEANCEVLIDLAFYVQRLYPEALSATEQLRLSARELQWHVERLRGAQAAGNLESAIPMYAQRAAAIYYLMTRRLLALYGEGSVNMLQELEKAL
jgi:hypothetical protein